MRPSPEADKRTLIRRLIFDLHGLPPTPEEVEDFVTDNRPDAYTKLVDRLLASPRYGERWGRHWLDVAHYADTHGYDKDKRRPNAWPYRDYVINALNADKPYGRFVEEQIAGDVLYPEDPMATVATGFIAAGPWDFVGHVELREGTVDKKITRSIDRDDMVSSTMASFTSLTVNCARCHDHKFDPIRQDDYYSLQAVFAGVERAERPYDSDPKVHQRRLELDTERYAAKRDHVAIRTRMESFKTDRITAIIDEINPLKLRIKKFPSTRVRANGYHSAIEAQLDVMKWVQVDLGESRAIDSVRLVPALPTDFKDTPGFGFPSRFRVDVSDDAAFESFSTIYDQSVEDYTGNAGDVLTTETGGVKARYIRITALRLWERTSDYVFALAELEAMAGEENIARDAAVSSLDQVKAGRWSMAYLVDGYDSRNRIGAGVELGEREKAEKHLADLRADLEAERLSLLSDEERADLSRLKDEVARVDSKLGKLPKRNVVYAAAPFFDPSWQFQNPPTVCERYMCWRGVT